MDLIYELVERIIDATVKWGDGSYLDQYPSVANIASLTRSLAAIA